VGYELRRGDSRDQRSPAVVPHGNTGRSIGNGRIGAPRSGAGMTDWFLAADTPLHLDNAVAALIVVDGSGYLLQRRDNVPQIFFPDHWGLFGGAIDPGETPEAALRRELREELMLDVA